MAKIKKAVLNTTRNNIFEKSLFDLSDLRKQYDIWQSYMKEEFNEEPRETSDSNLVSIAVDSYTKEMESLNKRNVEYINEQKSVLEQKRLLEQKNFNKALSLDGKYITFEQLVEIEVLPEFEHLTNGNNCTKVNKHTSGCPDFQWFIVEFSNNQSIDVYIKNKAF